MPHAIGLYEEGFQGTTFPGGDVTDMFHVMYIINKELDHYAVITSELQFEGVDEPHRLYYDGLESCAYVTNSTAARTKFKGWRVVCSEAVDNDFQGSFKKFLSKTLVHLPWESGFEHACLEDPEEAGGDNGNEGGGFDPSRHSVQTCAADSALVGRFWLQQVCSGLQESLQWLSEMSENGFGALLKQMH